MKKLYLVIHQLAKDRYHYALSDEVGEPLAETREFPSEAECRAIKDELVGILKDCANGRKKASAYQCGQYVYHAIKQDDVFLLRTKTSDTLDESKVVWDQLMQCVRGEIIDYEYLRGNISKIVNIDPAVMSYMYSLDGMGQMNFLNYTAEVPWEHQDSWLYDGQTKQMSELYRSLFYTMPRSRAQEYEIALQTGIWEGAGTAGAVYLTIYGRKPLTGYEPRTEEIPIAPGQRLETGRLLVVRYKAKEDLGLLQKIRIRYENPKKREDSREWFLEDVSIREAGSRVVRYFPVDHWVNDTKGSHYQDFTVEGKYGVPERYEITLKTADGFRENKDSGVSLAFISGAKKSETYRLGTAKRDQWGGTEKFILHVSEKLEAIDRLVVESGSGCHLLGITVRNTSRNKSWNFPCDLKFRDPMSGSITTKTLVAGPGPGEAAAYAVRIQTGDRMNAGTDADVFITLHGTKDSTGEWKLQGPGNDFERNKLGIYRVAAKHDIGELTSIAVRHNNYWPLAGWFLENVEVENVVTRKSREFPCHRWLARDEDGGVIQRNLEAVPEGCEPVRYNIRVRTGDFDRAATMARVYITLNGTLGASGEYEFVDMREAFMEGKTGELLMVRAKDLGEITSISVRHTIPGGTRNGI